MNRFITILGGLLLGGFAGFLVSIPVLIVTTLTGPTAWVDEEPLHGWMLFVGIFWGCILVGAAVGCIIAWRALRRTRPEVES